MKISLLVLVLFTITRLSGAIPDSIGGFVYRETRNVGRDGQTRAFVLGQDGRFSGLYQSMRTGAQISSSVGDLKDNGTYVYRKLDEKSAELIFNDTFNETTTTRALLFTSDTNGDAIVSSNLALGGSFRLVPLGAIAPLVNCSNRSFVRTGGTAYSGFVLSAPSVVLVRVIGPSLAVFKVTEALRDPKLTVFAGASNLVVGSNDDWPSATAQPIGRIGAVVGAFPLAENSKDSAAILSLSAGTYIAHATSADPTDSGEVLIEIYLIP